MVEMGIQITVLPHHWWLEGVIDTAS